MLPRARLALSTFVLLATIAVASACGQKIGDGCRVSNDCVQTSGDRQCDNSQPGGYCTILGCDERACPDEAACVRFFPTILDTARTCDPRAPNGCNAEDLCLRASATAADGEGVCVPRASERRFCVLKCGGNDDCRDDYECRATAEPQSVPYRGGRTKYCAPKPRRP